MTEARLGKMPTTAVRRLKLLVEPLERVRASDLSAMGLGEREVGEQVRLGIEKKPSTVGRRGSRLSMTEPN
jgi:hypothetical protein